jgi:hypothetical protein
VAAYKKTPAAPVGVSSSSTRAASCSSRWSAAPGRPPPGLHAHLGPAPPSLGDPGPDLAGKPSADRRRVAPPPMQDTTPFSVGPPRDGRDADSPPAGSTLRVTAGYGDRAPLGRARGEQRASRSVSPDP